MLGKRRFLRQETQLVLEFSGACSYRPADKRSKVQPRPREGFIRFKLTAYMIETMVGTTREQG